MATGLPPRAISCHQSRTCWLDRARRHRHDLARLPVVAPFVFLYLVLSWAYFVPAADYRGGYFAIRRREIDYLLFEIPDLGREPLIALRNLLIAPFINQHSTQIVYVSALLLLFGVAVETDLGTRAAVALFFGTTFVGALAAAGLLYLIYPELTDADLFRRGWNDLWSGGSAGCFGLMGAVAARARRPWLALGLVLLWELNVTIWYLQNYTPAFHLPALLAGFALTPRPAPQAPPLHPRQVAG